MLMQLVKSMKETISYETQVAGLLPVYTDKII